MGEPRARTPNPAQVGGSRCLHGPRSWGRFPLPASRAPGRPASPGRIRGLSGGRRERHRRSGIRGNRMGPGAHPPRDLPSACGPFSFCAPVPSGRTFTTVPSVDTASGPVRTGCPFRIARKPGREPRSSTGGSSGCGWHADARTGTAIPSICSHARQHTGRHRAPAGSRCAHSPTVPAEAVQCARSALRSIPSRAFINFIRE